MSEVDSRLSHHFVCNLLFAFYAVVKEKLPRRRPQAVIAISPRARVAALSRYPPPLQLITDWSVRPTTPLTAEAAGTTLDE
jgi:hypothetical protein